MRALGALLVFGLACGGCLCGSCSCTEEQNAVLEAARGGDVAAVRRFLAAGGSPAMSCWTPSGSRAGSNHALIDAAAASGAWELVSVVAVEPELRARALDVALQRLDGELAQRLLDAGVPFDVGRSGVFVSDALGASDPERRRRSLELLARLGADFDATSEGETPLTIALRHLSLADERYASEGRCRTIPLCREDVVFLVQHARRLDVPDQTGATPLHQVVDRGEAGLARLLLDRGAQVDSRDPRLRTPLMLAGGHLPLAQLLLERGADLEARDDAGQTPLMHAAWTDARVSLPVVRLLVARGARLDRADAERRTALTLAEAAAEESGDGSVVTSRKQKGARAAAPPFPRADAGKPEAAPAR
jgi:hypothetical protein